MSKCIEISIKLSIIGFVYYVAQRIILYLQSYQIWSGMFTVSELTEHSICFMILASLCAIV